MTWARLDDNFHAHPRVLMAGLEANGLYARALSYCGNYLTDGFVPREWVEIQGGKRNPAKRLVDTGLFQEVEDGYIIPGFLERNPSREKVEADREKERAKKAKQYASRGVSPGESPGETDDFSPNGSNGNPARTK